MPPHAHANASTQGPRRASARPPSARCLLASGAGPCLPRPMPRIWTLYRPLTPLVPVASAMHAGSCPPGGDACCAVPAWQPHPSLLCWSACLWRSRTAPYAADGLTKTWYPEEEPGAAAAQLGKPRAAPRSVWVRAAESAAPVVRAARDALRSSPITGNCQKMGCQNYGKSRVLHTHANSLFPSHLGGFWTPGPSPPGGPRFPSFFWAGGCSCGNDNISPPP